MLASTVRLGMGGKMSSHSFVADGVGLGLAKELCLEIQIDTLLGEAAKYSFADCRWLFRVDPRIKPPP